MVKEAGSRLKLTLSRLAIQYLMKIQYPYEETPGCLAISNQLTNNNIHQWVLNFKHTDTQLNKRETDSLLVCFCPPVRYRHAKPYNIIDKPTNHGQSCDSWRCTVRCIGIRLTSCSFWCWNHRSLVTKDFKDFYYPITTGSSNQHPPLGAPTMRSGVGKSRRWPGKPIRSIDFHAKCRFFFSCVRCLPNFELSETFQICFFN